MWAPMLAGSRRYLRPNITFEVLRVVQDDLSRSTYYNSNAQRNLYQAAFRDYGEFLASLEMSAEIAPFSPVYMERITQLINETNQFNLTTKRYTSAEVRVHSPRPDVLTLYGRLADRFGDNGLVSVLIGRAINETLEMDLWLMSCRVINREMELAMFDAVVEQCQARGIRKIVGIYIPSKKTAWLPITISSSVLPQLRVALRAANCGTMRCLKASRRRRVISGEQRTRPVRRLRLCRRRRLCHGDDLLVLLDGSIHVEDDLVHGGVLLPRVTRHLATLAESR